MRRLFFALSIASLALLGWGLHDEMVARRPWKKIQREWNQILVARGLPAEPIRLRELTVPELDLHDRCTSCHLGIDREGFGDDVPRHLRTHPRRAELLAPHPPSRFGCTPCHQGQGPQTKGVGWADFDHGRDDPYWERPLLSGDLVQATCLDCHATIPKGAEVLARGRLVFEEARCYGCHTARNFSPPAGLAAPSLLRLRDKMNQSFAEEWMRDPHALRPTTRMPAFWPSAGPAREAEPRAIATYLAAIPDPEAPAPSAALPAGPALPDELEDPAAVSRGRTLFDRVGCRGCHQLGTMPAPADDPPELHFGPALDGVGRKASPRWLSAWLRSPRAVWADARMPDMRLADREIVDLVSFLTTLRKPEERAATTCWPRTDEAQVEAGKQAILRLGCVGCHEVPGIAREGRTGPDLDDFGDRTPDALDLGSFPPDCGNLPKLACFALYKIKEPRRFVSPNVPTLTMPEAKLSDADARAAMVFLLGNRDRKIPASHRAPVSSRARAIAEADLVLQRHNCRGCHEIGRLPAKEPTGESPPLPDGGYIARHYAEPGLAPPPLTFAGDKYQYAWLWSYLRRPTTIRAYLEPRMPQFSLTDAEIDTIVAGLAARTGAPYPVETIALAAQPAPERKEAERLFAAAQCGKCHPATGRGAVGVQSQAELAPDLALAPSRLKPGWLRRWLLDPQALQPGTRMPSFFSALDEDQPDVRAAIPGFFGNDAKRQIEALTGLVLSSSR